MKVRDIDAIELPFANRSQAGKLLAQQLLRFKDDHPLVLGLPRGGVPVASEIANNLEADLDLLFVRKIGAPNHPEYGIGAVVDGENPQLFIDRDLAETLAVPSSYIQDEAGSQLREIERQRKAYIGSDHHVPVTGRTVIVVDDGIATGGTVRAALRAIRQMGPHQVILAVPVAAPDTILSLADECDEIVCLATPDPFYAVGAHYEDFTQTSDQEVKDLLRARVAEPADHH